MGGFGSDWGFIAADEDWKTKREVLLQKRATFLILLLFFFSNFLVARFSLAVLFEEKIQPCSV